ncbi:YbjN domain-containing protein [Streptomyces sp. NBC_01257]|uniref:YbjN domain-containing protein n=1 Tax=Streptomyces sp. NBC_01257 TaxID=2903799 RepID=UPI002DDB5026|nr:YbjN domain-containing protein [Streptomyces sp. NBC_01257]WRZ66285.1 YbjN domain-containing protein [Streptomyces sp. NBC_01257]
MADVPGEAAKTQVEQAEAVEQGGQAETVEQGGQAEAGGQAAQVSRIIEATFEDAGLDWESPAPGSYVVQLPGTRKLATTCSLIVGAHALSLNAFVIRHPDENDAAVHRWLLERNLRLFAVSYAIDSLGDVYLVGKLPLSVVTPEELDRLLGAVLEAADGAFNSLLELGFASAIRKEYAWRVANGESTRNLDAFTHLTQRPGN